MGIELSSEAKHAIISCSAEFEADKNRVGNDGQIATVGSNLFGQLNACRAAIQKESLLLRDKLQCTSGDSRLLS